MDVASLSSEFIGWKVIGRHFSDGSLSEWRAYVRRGLDEDYVLAGEPEVVFATKEAAIHSVCPSYFLRPKA